MQMPEYDKKKSKKILKVGGHRYMTRDSPNKIETFQSTLRKVQKKKIKDGVNLSYPQWWQLEPNKFVSAKVHT